MNKKTALIALGGNALLESNQEGTYKEQFDNVLNTVTDIVELIKKDYNIIITHGNGPQVGNDFLRNQAGAQNYNLPIMPLDFCGSNTQGSIGYMLDVSLRNILRKNNIEKEVVTLVTEVLVDKHDSAFQNLTKPVGPYYSELQAKQIMESEGTTFAEDPLGRGWRKVVASPKPIDILNKKAIKNLIKNDFIVIAVGGGGIPVFKDQNNLLTGVEAVIDKDLASSLLATEIKADEFYILTDIDKVKLNLKKPNETSIDTMSCVEAKKYENEGHFAKGSMLPKVLAAVNFVEKTNNQAIITHKSNLKDKTKGTIIE